MNPLYELVIGIAKYLFAAEKTCTFDELATLINSVADTTYSGGRGTAKVVSEAYRYAARMYGQETADIIAAAFTDRYGDAAYD